MGNIRDFNYKGFSFKQIIIILVILTLVIGLVVYSVLMGVNKVENKIKEKDLYEISRDVDVKLNEWRVLDTKAVTVEEQMLGNSFIAYTQVSFKDTWICLDSVNIINISNKNDEISLMSALGIGDKNIVVSSLSPVVINEDESISYNIVTAKNNSEDNTCSAVRYNSSGNYYEVLLVSESGDYAFSRADKGNVVIDE